MSFGIFLMRQHIAHGIPDELLDAARVDGASELRIFLRIIVPLCSSAIGAIGILAFIQAWWRSSGRSSWHRRRTCS